MAVPGNVRASFSVPPFFIQLMELRFLLLLLPLSSLSCKKLSLGHKFENRSRRAVGCYRFGGRGISKGGGG